MFLDTLKKEMRLNFWQWLHNGSKETGQVGLFSLLQQEKGKQKATCLICERLHMASTQVQDIQHDCVA